MSIRFILFAVMPWLAINASILGLRTKGLDFDDRVVIIAFFSVVWLFLIGVRYTIWPGSPETHRSTKHDSQPMPSRER